ncbi:MAG: hypothetical protein ACRD2N_08440 [Vicinamibacterales bacterium]
MTRVKPHATTTLVAALAFFSYSVLVRTDGITTSFLLLGEQTRDWTLALGNWWDLPLTGAPSTAGGRGLGPAYYWVLWLGRQLVGPFSSNLPHGGGISIALLQAIADTCLLVALMRWLPLALALAAMLTIATQPFEVGLSAAIWNPPVATAFAKLAMALMLGLESSSPRWRVAATAAVAWLGVQAHASGVFVAAPILAAIILEPLLRRQWTRSSELLVGVVTVLFVLQIPYGVAMLRSPADVGGPTVALASFSDVSALDPGNSFTRVTSVAGWLISDDNDSWSFGWVMLAALGLVVWRWPKEARVLAVTAGPIATATLLFAAWTRPYESYWFMTLATPAVITCGFAVAALPWALARTAIAVALLALVLLWQPSRVADSKNFFRYPQYRALLEGSKAAARAAPTLRRLQAGFEVHETTDVSYMYRILGGRITPDGPRDATIQPDGTVTFTLAAQP